MDDIKMQLSFATSTFPAQNWASSGSRAWLRSLSKYPTTCTPTAWSSKSVVGLAEIATTRKAKETYDPLQNTRSSNVSHNITIAVYEAKAVKMNWKDKWILRCWTLIIQNRTIILRDVSKFKVDHPTCKWRGFVIVRLATSHIYNLVLECNYNNSAIY